MSQVPPSANTSACTPPAHPLVASKLFIPPVRPGLVSRPRLLARLDQGLTCRLILLSGPAGSGKTTLLSEWLARGERPSAWLSLEPGDSDLARFFGYLIAALRTVVPGAGEASQALLKTVPMPPLESVLATLINEIVAAAPEGRPIVLVLDDYHAIASPAIHSGVTFLLEHLPPAMHLVIATRIDPPLPLSRFRARGQMVEVRASDLRFTLDETARVRLWLAQGDLDAAERWVRERQGQTAALPALLREMQEIACARVALAACRPAEALALLAPLAVAAERQERRGRLIEILALQALAMQATGDTVHALPCLEKALALAEPGGYVRVFVDEGAPMAALLGQAHGASPTYVARLLAAFHSVEHGTVPLAAGARQAGLVEPLSERELEVLQLLAGGLTNQEIARRLVITLPTVKSHTASIYGKLAVHSRREAVLQATNLGILP